MYRGESEKLNKIKADLEEFKQGDGKFLGEWLLFGKILQEKSTAWDSDDEDG